MVNTGHIHVWQNSTSDIIQICDSRHCKAVRKLIAGEWVVVAQESKGGRRKASESGFKVSEWEMLNAPIEPDYVDHRRAEKDLKNYWL